MTRTATIVYDTHAAVRRLAETGMPERQAEGVVREQALLLEHNLATKADIEGLRQGTQADIEVLRQETKADIDALRQETKANIDALRQETKANIEILRQETKTNIEILRQGTKADIEVLRQETKTNIEAAKNSLVMWMVGVGLGVAALVIAASELL